MLHIGHFQNHPPTSHIMLKLHLIGDSNVDRYISVVKAAKEDPAIQETTFARAANLVQLKEALVPSTPNEPHPNVVLACLTNPVTNHPFNEYKTMVNHCNETFAQILAWIQEGRGAVPGTMRQVYLFLPILICLFRTCQLTLSVKTQISFLILSLDDLAARLYPYHIAEKITSY